MSNDPKVSNDLKVGLNIFWSYGGSTGIPDPKYGFVVNHHGHGPVCKLQFDLLNDDLTAEDWASIAQKAVEEMELRLASVLKAKGAI